MSINDIVYNLINIFMNDIINKAKGMVMFMKIKYKIIACVVFVVCIFIFAGSFLNTSDDTDIIITDSETLSVQLSNRDDLSSIDGKVLNDNPSLSSDKILIPGFTQMNNSNYPTDIDNMSITIRAVGSYSGPYVEDGSNLNVKNTVGIVVRNNSDQMIEACVVILEASDGSLLQFVGSSIPANSDCFILEKNQYSVKDNDSFIYKDVSVSYNENCYINNDIIEVKCQNKVFALENKSNSSYSKVYVCYKNKVNGIYFGGITYRVTYTNIEPDQIYTKAGNHFSILSDVVFVQTVE